jgi:hypothetical protein
MGPLVWAGFGLQLRSDPDSATFFDHGVAWLKRAATKEHYDNFAMLELWSAMQWLPKDDS